MKKIFAFLFITLFACFGALKAQAVDGVKLSEIEAEYVQIMIDDVSFGGEINIHLDYGQKVKKLFDKSTLILGKNGKPLTFNSPADALNFMAKYGYAYQDRVRQGAYAKDDVVLLRKE